jgi:hypothetical protein
MSRSLKIFLGVLSFIPIITFIIYIFRIFGTFMNVLSDPAIMQGDEIPEEFLAMLTSMIFFIMGMMINFALMITYIVFAIKDVSASESDKILWVLLLVFISLIAVPVYWIARIWTNKNFSFEKGPTDRTN